MHVLLQLLNLLPVLAESEDLPFYHFFVQVVCRASDSGEAAEQGEMMWSEERHGLNKPVLDLQAKYG